MVPLVPVQLQSTELPATTEGDFGLSFNFLPPRSVARVALRSWCAISLKGPGELAERRDTLALWAKTLVDVPAASW